MNAFALLAAASALLALGHAVLPTPTETYPYKSVLQDGDRYVLYWKVDAGTITFETHTLTTGWVGLGLSPTGEMEDSDIVIGWVSNGQATIKDRFSTETALPPLDAQQDIKTISGKSENGYTILKFSRALNTGDCVQDMIIVPDTLRVIWSYGADLPTDDTHILKHTNRGTVSINFLDAASMKPVVIPSDVTSWDITMQPFNVPTAPTTYQCRSVRVPSGIYQFVGYEPIISNANKMNVHHIVVYGCNMDLGNSFDGVQFECFGSDQGQQAMRCRHPIAIWAVGGDAYFFPDNTGFPMGGTRDPQFLIMEVHYDNPNHVTTMVDQSGMRFYKTDKLRKTEIGIVEIGRTVDGAQLVPPKVSEFVSTGVCHSDCTTQSLSDDGIQVFGTLLHSHLLGSKLRVRQFRGDKEIGDLGIDNHYDFAHQTVRVFSTPRTVKKGDTLVVECALDSRSRAAVTFGGLGTDAEMCLAYAFYYPRSDFGQCQGSPIWTPELLKALGVIAPDRDGIFGKLMQKTDWSTAEVKALQDFENTANFTVLCLSSAMVPFDVMNKVRAFPAFVGRFQPPPDPCIKSSVSVPQASFALLSGFLLLHSISL